LDGVTDEIRKAGKSPFDAGAWRPYSGRFLKQKAGVTRPSGATLSEAEATTLGSDELMGACPEPGEGNQSNGSVASVRAALSLGPECNLANRLVTPN